MSSACHGYCEKSTSCFGLFSCWKVKRTTDEWVLTLLISTFIAFLFGLIVPIIVGIELRHGINDSVVVSSTSSSSYDTWQTNTKPDSLKAYYDVYLFDVTNAAEVTSGAMPVVVQRGPYSYKEMFDKFNIEFYDNNEKVSFYNWEYFLFDPSHSADGVLESDNYTQVLLTALFVEYVVGAVWNTSMVNETTADQIITLFNSTGYTVEQFVEKLLICSKPEGANPFLTQSAFDLYWGHFNDPMLVNIENLLIAVNETFDSDIDLSTFTTYVPGIKANLSSRSDTLRRSNVNKMKTGEHDIDHINEYIVYNNMSEMHVCLNLASGPAWDEEAGEVPACWPYQHEWTVDRAKEMGWTLVWLSDYTNRITGTDGMVNRHPCYVDEIEFFVDDIYRTGWSDFKGWTYDFHGLSLRRYGVRWVDLQNTSVIPGNYAWRQFGPEGLTNFTGASGFPYFGSKPHFLDSQSSLVTDVIGMSPNRDIHDTFIDIEPNTGAMFRVHQRLMLSNYIVSYSWPSIATDVISNPLINALLTAYVCQMAYGDQTRQETIADCQANAAQIQAGVQNLHDCLAEPVEWNIQNDLVYLPYSWTDQWATQKESQATAVKVDIYATQAMSNDIQKWAFVTSGILLGLALMTAWVARTARKEVELEMAGVKRRRSRRDEYDPPIPPLMGGKTL